MTVQTPPTHHHTNSTSALSQLLLTWFWWNFKGRFLWTFRTDSNSHGDICRGNICPGDICPYQEYLSSNCPDFDETLKIGSWEHLEQIPTVMVTFVDATFVQATSVHSRKRDRCICRWENGERRGFVWWTRHAASCNSMTGRNKFKLHRDKRHQTKKRRERISCHDE